MSDGTAVGGTPAPATGGTPTQPAAQPAGTGAAPPAQTTPEAWYKSYDAETLGWLQNRGIDKLSSDAALAEVIKGHRSLEKHMGVPADRLLRLPERMEGADADAIYDRLGRPADAKDYKVTVPEGMEAASPEFVDWAKSAFHKIGLSAAQGEALTNSWNEFMAAQATAAVADVTAQVQDATQKLQKEWGAAYEQNRAVGTRARVALELSDQDVDAISSSLGIERTVKLFHKIGSKIMEDTFQAPDTKTNPDRMLTPTEARTEINRLQGDKEFRQKLISGDTTAKEQWARLNRFAVA